MDPLKNIGFPYYGAVKLQNPFVNVEKIMAHPETPHFLYHFDIDTSDDIEGTFGDTRFVLMCGSPKRAETLAKMCHGIDEIAGPIGKRQIYRGPFSKTERFSLFKVGPVITVSHGMGMPSMSICLHEITKLLAFAKAQNVVYLRIGTSGGLRLRPGTVVVSTGTLNGALEAKYNLDVLGIPDAHEDYSTDLSTELAQAIIAQRPSDVEAVTGKTIGTNCFYEGQARLDGAFCSYDDVRRKNFLKKAHEEHSVSNIEMEGPYFAYFVNRMKIPGTLICCTLLNRLDDEHGDQVTSTMEELGVFSNNANRVALNYVVHVIKTEAELEMKENS